MAYQLFRTWVLKGRQKLSKLEQHLVISYTKGPKDPKCIYYLTEALRPTLAKRVSLYVSDAQLLVFAPNIVETIAIISAIALNLQNSQNIKGFFYSIQRSYQPTHAHMLNSKGHYVNHGDLLGLLKAEMKRILEFFFNEERTSSIDILNKKQLEQNFDIFHDYIDSVITAINTSTIYAD